MAVAKPGRVAATSAAFVLLALVAILVGRYDVAAATGSFAFLCAVVAAVLRGEDRSMDRPERAERTANCPSCGTELPAGEPRVIIRGEAYCDDSRCTSVAW